MTRPKTKVEKWLGRPPKDRAEYKRVWRYLKYEKQHLDRQTSQNVSLQLDLTH